uniref:protein IQ-DOMAIN 27-like n=1 Tax=Erigeron canadensis TaxID=72917 RepID=UPI001CB8D862|nr:protein IQ-DOMAIN 27-like [Erigeron canadensis]
MGKASSKWVKGLLHMKKNMDKENDKKTTSSCLTEVKPSIMTPLLQVVSSNNISPPTTNDDPTNYILPTPEKEHAVAVVDAALAVAEAAVAVVRLTSSHGKATLFDLSAGSERWAAALKIQTVFRAYLARKALRALKGLVKFQALVKGFLVRKRAAATIYSMQALLRAQAAILSQRARRSFTDHRVITRHRKSTAGKTLRALKGLVKFQALVRGFLVRKRAAATLYSIQALFRAQTAILSQRARCSFIDHRVTRHRKSIEMRFDQETCSRFAKSNRLIAPTTRAQSVCGEGYFRPYTNNHPSYMANTQVIFGETKVS